MNPKQFDYIIIREKAERFNYRKASEQVKKLIEILSQLQELQKDRDLTEKKIRKIFESPQSKQIEIRREKYTQISDRAFRFLTSGAFNNLPEKEKEIVLFYLLISPSPKTQDEILNSLSYLFKNQEDFEIKDPEAIIIERKKLIDHLIFKEALEGAIRDRNWYSLLDFFKNPENQKIRPDIIQEALEGAIREKLWNALLDFFKNPENQKIRPDIFKKTLEGAKKYKWWGHLLDFFKNPENQKIRPDILQEALEGAKRDGWWGALIYFFQNKENQKIRPDILQEALEGAIRDRRWGPLLDFFQNKENQKIRPDILQEALEGAKRDGWWDDLLDFFKNPENQKIRPDIFQEILEGAIRSKRWGTLLNFFQNPENQKIRPDIFKKTLEGAIRDRDWYSLLDFFKNPENQKIRPEIFKKILEGAIRSRDWSSLLELFQSPENQPKINESFINVEKSLSSTISSISDENLRAKFLNQTIRYLANNESLALISLSPNEDLPLLITGKNLGIDPFIVLSWSLREEEKKSLLPIFISLADKGVKFDFPFPYYPRQELKKTRKYNEMLISYFRTLDFISSLPEKLVGFFLIEDHFTNIKKIIEEYKIKQTQLDISYAFLRKILIEIKQLEKRVIKRMRELLKISQDVTDEEMIKFIKESSYFSIIITLAIHYSKIYKNGLTLLGKIAYSLIKGNYFDIRYDLSDQIIKEQLNPLLENKNPEEYPQIIEKWRNPYYTFKILSQKERERIETAEINWDQVWEHIKSQTYGDKHYEQLFEIEEFKNLDEEDKNNIRKVIDVLFSYDKKTINFGEIRKMLQGKLDEKKINILIGYLQLLRDISLKQKTPQEILNTIQRLNKNIQENLQEFGQLVMWQQDIYNYLTQLIKEREIERKITRKQTILLSYITDHPKTLFEIGKYPVSTCQDYESTGDFNKALLGYVFDAHIKALVLREIEIETEEEINEQSLNKAKVELDEEKETIKIILPDNKTIEGRILKPIARRIIMLGRKDGKPMLLLEPIYSKFGREDENYKKFLDAPLGKIKNKLNLEITESARGVSLPPSRNLAGYYRDV
jgi:hypothetical protein